MDESDTKSQASPFFSGVGIAVLAVALTGLVLGLWAWWDGRDTAQTLTQTLGVKLAEQSKLQTQTAVQIDQMIKDLRESQNRVAQLEGKLAEFQGQRVALEEMYRDLARAPDDWLLAEIEQTLNIASRELVLAANVSLTSGLLLLPWQPGAWPWLAAVRVRRTCLPVPQARLLA